MAKICRVLEKLRQLRTDQLRKSGSVCMLPFSAIKDSRVISSGPGVRLGRLKTLIFASHFKGAAECRHQDQQTPEKQQNKPSVCFTAPL